MRAVVWHGYEDVRVDQVADPVLKEPTDAIVQISSTAICGSDLHLYRVLPMFMQEGDIIGHEPMGTVVEVGGAVTGLRPGDRVVIPFNISCGHCYMCDRQLYAQCETTQVREHHKGASLFGYTKLYGHVPGAQSEYLRVPHADFGPIKIPQGPPDERYLFLSDILPTAWQAVRYADVQPGESIAVFGLGPVGQFCVRAARVLGLSPVIGVDLVPERLAMAARHGATIIDGRSCDDVPAAIMDLTNGRGADAVIDAVGMEAHGSPVASTAQRVTGMLPKAVGEGMAKRAGIDRLAALQAAIASVRRCGTVSIVGVYGGQVDPLPMMDLFDKGVQLRMGQAHVRRWVDELMPLIEDDADPLGVADLITHTLPLDEAPRAYEMFQKKQDGCIKVVLRP